MKGRAPLDALERDQLRVLLVRTSNLLIRTADTLKDVDDDHIVLGALSRARKRLAYVSMKLQRNQKAQRRRQRTNTVSIYH